MHCVSKERGNSRNTWLADPMALDLCCVMATPFDPPQYQTNWGGKYKPPDPVKFVQHPPQQSLCILVYLVKGRLSNLLTSWKTPRTRPGLPACLIGMANTVECLKLLSRSTSWSNLTTIWHVIGGTCMLTSLSNGMQSSWGYFLTFPFKWVNSNFESGEKEDNFEGGERPEGGEFILSARDWARPRYHSSLAKLLLSHFSPHISFLIFFFLLKFLWASLSFFCHQITSFPFSLIFPWQLSSSLKIENNDRESQLLPSSSSRCSTSTSLSSRCSSTSFSSRCSSTSFSSRLWRKKVV